MNDFFAAHTERLTKFQLPAYSPDCSPNEYYCMKLKKAAMHLKSFATFDKLTASVDRTLNQFASLPSEILSLMGRYCESLDAEA